MSHYSFHSTTSHFQTLNGHEVQTTEEVKVENGKGKKTVISLENGVKKVNTHPLTQSEIKNIKSRKFMPGLFDPCYDGLGPCLTNSLRLSRKGKSKNKSKGVRKSRGVTKRSKK
jgi:hypothetical protein